MSRQEMSVGEVSKQAMDKTAQHDKLVVLTLFNSQLLKNCRYIDDDVSRQ